MSVKLSYEEMEKRVQELAQVEIERKKTEEELDQIFSMSLDMICIADINTATFIKVNSAFTEILGYNEKELLDIPFLDFVHLDDIDATRTVIERELQMDAKVINFDNRYRCKDGSYRWLSWVSHPNTVKGVTYAVAHDITERKQAEEKLNSTRDRLLETQQFAKLGWWEFDINENQITWSDELYEIFGITHDEDPLSFERVMKLVHPDYHDYHNGQIELLVKTGAADFEYPVKRPDGKTPWIWSKGKLKLDEDGNPAYMFGITQDITERKQTEELLRENIHFLESLKTINQVVNSSNDLDQMLNSVIASVFKLFDCDRAWLLYPCDPNSPSFNVPIESARPEYPGGKDLNLSIPMTPPMKGDMVDALTANGPVTYGPGNEKSISADMHDKFGVQSQMFMSIHPKTGNAWMFEIHQCSYQRVWTDNERVLFKEIGQRIADGLSSLLYFRKLTKSEEKYRTVLTNIDDGYFEVDIAGNFTFSNDSMCKILGYPNDELVGMNNREYMDEENAKKVFKTFNNVYRTGMSTKALDWKLIKKDGSECFIETVVSLIKDQNGNGIGFRGIARDITDRKQLESQLQQAMKMESIGTLAGGIAHDFNNLLMGIQGRTSLVLADKNSSHPDFEHLKGIEDYVKSAADLTKQLLGFARGGKYEVKPTDIKKMIKRSAQMFGRTKKEIEIHIDHQKDVGAVEADQGQLEQVLMNLYVNAWQAMPDGGDLYIQTKNVNLDENYVKPFKATPGRYVKISVTDTGGGMDEATKPKIFDPFFTTKEMGRGTGLGLAFVYGILKNHGGFINVYSEKGEGTTFNIYLPQSDRAALQEPPTVERLIKGSETILLVDDEEMIREVGQAMLEKLGYRIVVAVGGEQAVDVIKRKGNEIDLVILDLIMPGMDGGQTFDRIMEIRPELPVILASGYAINGKANNIMQRGCNGFIQKPFNLSELSQKVRKVLGEAKI
ncbi:MAG: PAS domain S-box protein [Desulfobacterales bacterium]|nr:PAS domain S-box protein [Desulfobacterales bacterium]